MILTGAVSRQYRQKQNRSGLDKHVSLNTAAFGFADTGDESQNHLFRVWELSSFAKKLEPRRSGHLLTHYIIGQFKKFIDICRVYCSSRGYVMAAAHAT